MVSRWLQFGLAGLLALIGAAAHADFFSIALEKSEEIRSYLARSEVQNRSQQNPMFGCYHLGRLQGVSDRLGKDIAALDSRAAGLSQSQFDRLNLAREFYQGLEQQLAVAIDGKGCDAMAKSRLKELNSGSASILEHTRLAIAATRTMSAQDIIIRCLYVGRISTLSERLKMDMDKRPSSAATDLFSKASEKVSRHAKACGLK